MNQSNENIPVIIIDDDDFQRKLLMHQLSDYEIKNIISFTNRLEAIDQINKRALYEVLTS